MLDTYAVDPVLGTEVYPKVFAGLGGRNTWANHEAILALKADIIDGLKANGAVLLPGAIADGASFEALTKDILPPRMRFVTLSSPRRQVAEGTFTSTEHSARQIIIPHQEAVYLRDWPGVCAFYCENPPETGGETTYASAWSLSRRLPTELLETFHKRGVRYIQTFREGYAPGWRDAFQTNDIGQVAEIAARHGMSAHPIPDGLRITYEAQGAIATDRGLLWANQAHLYHVSAQGAETAEALLGLFGLQDLPRHATYGDGEEIPDATLNLVRSELDAIEQAHTWGRGDLLILDNLRVMHGRRPFTGPRRILAAFAEGVASSSRTDTGV
ncbi:MAG: TauD/TfdA family dioxygenase [Sulfitobacter sp.]|uniref:TauD/TfdA family dioxygenase n=1 Tax=Roseibium sp. TaxID=1936156 RepID=UPI0032635C1C